MNDEMLQQVEHGDGFIAALDQSGGSTPKALALYGVTEDQYSGDDEMFDAMHAMRTRMITSPCFGGDRILGAILFEGTMDRDIDGKGSAEYLWTEKQVVPFLKVDTGLSDQADGVQVMKPIPGLDELLARAAEKGVFGTKMRSVVAMADKTGVDAIADQQFEVGRQILDAGLIPILEPEVLIDSPEKGAAEDLLRSAIHDRLDHLEGDRPVMLKLTLPDQDNFYADLIAHPKVLRVVALSGGYSREVANEKLARNHGMIASFSRALADDLRAQQSDEAFNATLNEAIESIYEASLT